MTEKNNYIGYIETGEVYIRATIRDKELFIESSFIRNPIGNGVILVTGKLYTDPEGMRVVCAVEFEKSIWGTDSARRWILEHRDSFSILENEKKQYNQLYTVPGVEIFASGTWNGDSYSNRDLEDMVAAFNDTKAKFKPFLKLGHDDGQKLLQADGLPAAGWLDNLRIKGTKLVADFVDVPKKIFELIKNKAYRKVSCEIYWNVDINGKVYPKMISACSLLGSDHPAVSSLDDILSMFRFNNYGELKSYTENKNDATVKVYSFSGQKLGGKRMSEKTENEIKLEYQLKEISEKVEALTKEIGEKTELQKSLEDKLSEQKKLTEDHAAKVVEFQKQAFDAQVEADLATLEKSGLVTPAMKDYVKGFLKDILSDKKEYSIKDKKFSAKELLSEIIKLSKASEVNLDNNSIDAEPSNMKTEVLEKEINEYMKQNSVSYGKAYAAVMRTKQN